jgi:hypothetical protein
MLDANKTKILAAPNIIFLFMLNFSPGIKFSKSFRATAALLNEFQ